MLKSRIVLALALPLALSSMAADAKLYKWVDHNGETHYGQTVPPEYADQHKVQLNKEGMEMQQAPQPTNTGKPAAPVKKTRAQIEQERYDNMLLATYANEGEIDDQRNRSLQLINARISGIQMQLKSAEDDLKAYQKDGRAAREIATGTQRVNNLKAQLADAQAEAAKVKAKFAADKARYHELTADQHAQ